MKKIKLFCIPYAGGMSTAYVRYKKYLHPSIELQGIELAGRGKRCEQSFYKSIDDAAEDVYELIKYDIDKYECAFWGHSMGCLILFELAHKLSDKNYNIMHLFFSGRQAPHLKNRDRTIHKLTDEEFKEEIIKYDGTPKEIFEQKELSDIFMPIFRADFGIAENYNYIDKMKRLNSEFTVLYGKYDNMSKGEVNSWALHTSKSCRVHEFEGGHFFIFEHVKEVADIMNKVLVGENNF